MELLTLKRGDTFKMHPSTLEADDGSDVDLTGYVIASQVRDKADSLIATLNITISGNTFESDAVNTSAWPLVDLYCDIQFTYGGITISSNTFIIRVEKDITHG